MDPADELPVTVQLQVDGEVVCETAATQPVKRHREFNDGHIGFRFGMERVWCHLRRGQKLAVHAGDRRLDIHLGRPPDVSDHRTGEPLPLAVGEQVLVMEKDGSRAGTPLLELIHSGHLINKKGRIQEPIDTSRDWAQRTMPEYRRIDAVLDQTFGKPAFVFYGAMLGFARDGGILAHDLDLDLAYLSEEHDPEAVRTEFFEVCAALIRANRRATPFDYKLQFPGRRISLTPCWFTDGTFYSTFGFVGDGFEVARTDLEPFQRVEHAGTPLWLPRNPAHVARYLYGRGWRYPDRGWAWREEYTSWPVSRAARLTSAQVASLEDLKASVHGP